MSTLRIAIYGRHSTDKQNPNSTLDQIDSCRPLALQLGGEVVGTFPDPEISGYRRDRPALRLLLQKCSAGEIDMVLCEAIDRIARDPEDLSWLGKKFAFDHIRFRTLNEGEIDETKLSLAAMYGTMFLSNLKQKTHRG